MREASLGGGQGSRGLRVMAGAHEQRFGARGFGERVQVLLVTADALLLQRAQIRRLAGSVLQRGEQRLLGRVRRVAQRVDGAAKLASFGFLTRRGTERTMAQ